jgi:hypothetical protein
MTLKTELQEAERRLSALREGLRGLLADEP